MPVATHSTDCQTLVWIERRAAGLTTHEIAAADGVRETQVRTATNRVLNADLAEGGETEKKIRGAYWPQVRVRRKGAA